jgi:nitroreductase
MHAEPWLFVVIQDREALKRYSESAKQALLEEGQHRLHDPGRTSNAFLRSLSATEFNIFYNAGTLILICARLTSPFSAADCWLAAENLMLMAPAMDLGTCCIGSALPTLNRPEIKAELGIPTDVTVVAAITVGVPAETPTPSHRKAPTILAWKKTGTESSSAPR